MGKTNGLKIVGNPTNQPLLQASRSLLLKKASELHADIARLKLVIPPRIFVIIQDPLPL